MAPSFNADLDGDVALVGNFTIWAMALVSGLFLGARVYIRQARNHLWWDDHLLVGGWIFTIAQSAVFSEMLRRGFAKATIAEPFILLLMLIGDNLQKFALSLTKLSFSLTLLRIFPSGWQRWTIITLLLVINCYYIAHLFLVWLNICDHPQANRIETSCLHPTNGIMLQVLGAFLSAASDFILAFLPLSRMLEVTLKSHDKWVAAVITTSIGVIAGLAGLVKGFEGIRLLDYESTRYFHSIWVFHVVGIAEPNATIVACSIPILRTFFRSKRACNGTVIPRGMGPYAQSNSAGKFPGGDGGSGKELNKHESTDTFSQHTIAQKQRDAQKQREREEEAAAEADAPGITRTRTVAVTYEDNMIVGSPPSGAADIEMLSRSAPI